MKKSTVTKMVEILKEVAESPTTEYNDGDIGACIHCHRVSYEPHTSDCLITRVKNLLREVGK